MQPKRYSFEIETAFDSPDFRHYLDGIARGLCEPDSYLKQDTKTSIWRSCYQDSEIVIKRYNTQNFWHIIRRSFRKSRAKNCWNMSAVFQNSGLGVSPRVAMIQEWFGPFKQRSWFINQHVDSIDLLTYLQAETSLAIAPEDLKARVADMDEIFSLLQGHRLSHGDMKATNILLTEDRLVMIDLDAAHQHRSNLSLSRARRKDWRRFMKNWRFRPDVSLAFEEINKSI